MCSRRPFQGMKPDHQHIKSVKKNAKTFNACLTACWMSFSTETQQHRSTCHFFRMPPQDWNMTYLHVFAKEIPTTNRNGPSNCHLPAEVRPKLANPFQLCQGRTTCWTEVDAEQWREIENHYNLVDFTHGPLSKWLTIQQFCGHLIASSFYEMCCTRYQEKTRT